MIVNKNLEDERARVYKEMAERVDDMQYFCNNEISRIRNLYKARLKELGVEQGNHVHKMLERNYRDRKLLMGECQTEFVLEKGK